MAYLVQAVARLKRYQDWERVRQAIGIVLDEARRRCPYDTHHLEKYSWKINRTREGVWSLEFATEDATHVEYAMAVHERLDVYHPHGEAKFLENAWTEKHGEFFRYLFGS